MSADPVGTVGISPGTVLRVNSSALFHHPVDEFLHESFDHLMVACRVIGGHKRSHKSLGRRSAEASSLLAENDLRAFSGGTYGCRNPGHAAARHQNVAGKAFPDVKTKIFLHKTSEKLRRLSADSRLRYFLFLFFRFRINTFRENRSSGRWERTLYVRREEWHSGQYQRWRQRQDRKA